MKRFDLKSLSLGMIVGAVAVLPLRPQTMVELLEQNTVLCLAAFLKGSFKSV